MVDIWCEIEYTISVGSSFGSLNTLGRTAPQLNARRCKAECPTGPNRFYCGMRKQHPLRLIT